MRCLLPRAAPSKGTNTRMAFTMCMLMLLLIPILINIVLPYLYCQGDSSGLWPKVTPCNEAAGLTYPSGLNPRLVKGPLRGRWPAMAAAVAIELRQEGAMVEGKGEAAKFLASVFICGLIDARDGLNRRQNIPHHRKMSVNGLDLLQEEWDEGEDDEGQTSENAAVMFLIGLRGVLCKPLLQPPTGLVDGNTPASLSKGDKVQGEEVAEEEKGGSHLANGRDKGSDKGNHLGQAMDGDGLPVSVVIQAVQTITSGPFLVGTGFGGGVDSGRLQLAATSVLGALVSGDGAEYMKAVTASLVGREKRQS
ncbi:unnamed protein product, partial [Choristocarpus tenellus]